jgi:hypothetical protein
MPTIQNKRGTASDLASINPILLDGEIVVESDTNKLKVGNGVYTWNELNYVNINTSGINIINSSGNFINLSVNGTGVSVSGHTHTSSDITNFNSTVSGLLPTISNSGNNRILTSTGSTVGINAESNLTFDGTTFVCSGSARIGNLDYIDVDNDYVFIRNFNDIIIFGSEELILNSSDGISSVSWGGRNLANNYGQPNFNWSGSGVSVGVGAPPVDDYALYVTGSGYFSNNVKINNQTANTIASFDANKNVTSLATGTYPSLTELSYVKGVTSAIQTQLNAKQNSLTNPVTGTGIASHIAYWNSSSGIVADSGQLYWDSTNNRLGIGTATPSGHLHVIGSGIFASGLNIDNQTASTIASFDSSKNIVSLSTATYPSLTELSYVKGVTSALQTQLNAKQNTLTNPVTGTGAANHIAYWTSSSGIAHDASQLFWDATNNRLGVGTASPSGALNVVGTGLFSTTTGIAPNALLDLYSATSGDMIFNVEGTNGSLFSVIDSLSGSLMSVNNNAGLPVFEVFSDDRVIAGRYNQNDFVISSGGNVGIGTASPTSKLHVIGTGNFSQNVLVNGISVRNTTLSFFTAIDNQPPASGFATLDTRNSIAVLDFDDTTEESAVFVGVVPDNANLASGLSVRIHWMATTATSGNCRWGVQFEDMNTDEDADSFDTATEAHSATNGTAGIPTTTTITCTTIDSLATSDFFRIKIYRDVSDTTNDTMTGDAELIAVEVRSVL